ncbi:serine/threonine protein kinase PrkC, regulator of stationary phase [Lachnospiraceae bacterium KM106-2]|nr:serine/threonine protein kinase PrkC, regulator of stationary phase [Lachnospiraceae bacterium KM106-2]
MSIVYLAMNENANKQWAIKEVRKEGIEDFEMVKHSLIAEINLLKKLSHPNLPSIVDVIETEGTFLVVMDYIEGVALDKILEEDGPIDQDTLVLWGVQLCNVLNYLHSREPAIIYRDLKPSNIMLKPDGTIVLIDFGTAREFKNDSAKDTTCLGTKGYAAPEQFGGKGQSDVRTDVYNLGTTLYHLITGHNPSEPPYEMYPIRHWNPTLSIGLEKIIQTCTQLNPEDRYQTCYHVLYELQHMEEIDDKYRKKKRKHMILFCCSLFLCTALYGISAYAFNKEKTILVDDYNSILEQGELSSMEKVKRECYSEAIRLEPKRKEAYMMLLQQYSEDCIFAKEEELELYHILQEEKKGTGITHLEALKSDEKRYGEFCYNMGILYWYYYEDKGNKHKQAANWFQDSLRYAALDKETTKKAKLFYEICQFHKRVRQLEYTSSFLGEYKKYWTNLVKLKSAFDHHVEEEGLTLQLYNEIVGQVFNYRSYFKADKVTEGEIVRVLNEISQYCDKFEIIKETKRKEIEQLKKEITDTIEVIHSTYHQNQEETRVSD